MGLQRHFLFLWEKIVLGTQMLTFSQSDAHTVPSTQHAVHSIQHTEHSTQLTVPSTQYTVQSTLHTVHSTQHTAHSTQYTVHSTQYTGHSTQYTGHSTQDTVHSTQSPTFYGRLLLRWVPLHPPALDQARQDRSRINRLALQVRAHHPEPR